VRFGTHQRLFCFGDEMNEIIFVVTEPPEGGYAAEALGHAIFTVADSLDELNVMVRDAVICHFEDADRPKMIRLHFVREEVLAV
jgi:hypothetical protein